MSPRTEYSGFSRPDFLADRSSAERTSGRQIDWENVAASFEGDDGYKAIPSGHPMAPAGDGRRIVPATNAAGNEANAQGLLEGPAHELEEAAPSTGFGMIVGGVVYEQLVPGVTAAIKTALGTRFFWETYEDTRSTQEES